jgi:hypothetical protein
MVERRPAVNLSQIRLGFAKFALSFSKFASGSLAFAARFD